MPDSLHKRLGALERFTPPRIAGQFDVLSPGTMERDYDGEFVRLSDVLATLERKKCLDCNGTGERPPDGKDSMGLPRWGDEMEDNRDRRCLTCNGTGERPERGDEELREALEKIVAQPHEPPIVSDWRRQFELLRNIAIAALNPNSTTGDSEGKGDG